MIRRLSLVPIALVSTLAIVLAACGTNTPARPELTDPKQILTETVTSLKDVKTFELTTSFTGTVTVPELGNLDLASTTLTGSFDRESKKMKFTLDAPAIMGTKVEALAVDGFVYMKIGGLLSGMLGGQGDKWLKSEISESAAGAVDDPAAFQKQIDTFNTMLAALPNPPTLGTAEKCGDIDCYKVTVVASADDLKVPSGAALDGDVTVDVFSRKTDLRPVRVVFGLTSSEIGTVSVTFNLAYDVAVNVEAPPADQVVDAPGGGLTP